MYVGFRVNNPLFMSDFNDTLNFSTDLSKNILISNFMKICQLGAGLFYADGQTSRHDEANNRLSQFCERT